MDSNKWPYRSNVNPALACPACSAMYFGDFPDAMSSETN